MRHWIIAILVIFLQGMLYSRPKLIPGLELTEEEVQQIARKYGEDFDMVENLRAQNILVKALELEQKLSFSTEVKQPEFVEIHSPVKCSYSQTVAADGFCYKSLEITLAGDNEVVKCVQNRDGQFFCRFGFWFKIYEIFDLSYFTSLALPIYESELKDSIYTAEAIMHNGRSCHKVTMTTLANKTSLVYANPDHLLFELSDIPKAKWFTYRPMKRVFIIDSRNHFIYSRQHYNIHNRKVYERNTGKPDFNDVKDEEFYKISGKIYDELIFLENASGRAFMRHKKSQAPGKFSIFTKNMKKRTSAFLARAFNFFLDYGSYITIPCFVLSVAGLIYFKRRR